MKVLGMDTYDLQARLCPALLAVGPLALLAGIWTADAWNTLSGLVAGIGGGIAVAYLLAQLARAAGGRVQSRLIAKWGGLHTTCMLRHGGPHLNPLTRAEYHRFLAARSGRLIPTEDDQRRDSKAADQAYESAIDWLRRHAKAEGDAMVQTELTIYGFCRNLVGLKPWALGIIIVCLAANGVALYYAYDQGADLLNPGLVLEVFLVVAFIVWLIVGDWLVDGAGWAYAKRLLSLCDRP